MPPQMTAFNFSKQNLFYLIVSHDKRPTHFSSSQDVNRPPSHQPHRYINPVDYPAQDLLALKAVGPDAF